MHKLIFFLLASFLLLPGIRAVAQTGTCEPATAEAFLDVGEVRTRILNHGGLFRRNGAPAEYRVPKSSNKNAYFAGNVWVSGRVEDEIRATAARSGIGSFWPGPLSELGLPPTDCKPFDQIWEINRKDIQQFIDGHGISDNLRDWPWQLGAPVVDGDDNPNNYNLTGGDLPELLGHQRLWWVMNDRGNTQPFITSKPLGFEIQASAFAYSGPALVEHETFYTYKLINKSTAPIEDTYFTFWTDADLGNFDDDYVGSDSLLGLAYYYNADNFDEGGEGYGSNPPAIGFTFLASPLANTDGLDNDKDLEIDEVDEQLGATVIMSAYKAGAQFGEPRSLEDYYGNARGFWNNRTPMLKGFRGFENTPWPDDFPRDTTRYIFSGDPVTSAFWSELNADSMGTATDPADRRLHMSTGPFTLAPGDSVDIAFVLLYARGNDHLDAVRELKQKASTIRNSASFFLGNTRVNKSTIPPARHPNHVLGFDQNFPNPFSTTTTIRYSLPQTMQVRLTVYDILGREVGVLVDAYQEAGIYTAEFNAGALPPGVYLARLEADFLGFTKRMLLIK